MRCISWFVFVLAYNVNVPLQSNGMPVNSHFSDIQADPGFVYTSNIDYHLFQSSSITNTSTSVGVWKLVIRDGGASGADPDTNSTELLEIVFYSDQAHMIRSAALFNGNLLLDNSCLLDTTLGTIKFSGLGGTGFTAPDDGQKSFTLRLSFHSSVVDNEQLIFTVIAAQADTSGSLFQLLDAGGALSSSYGNRNRVEVTADRLNFGIQPLDGEVYTILSPFEIHAVDPLYNIDLDVNASFSISTSGIGLLVSNPYTLVNGIATVSNVMFQCPQQGIVLYASSSMSTILSDTFDIDSADYNVGDYRTSPLFSVVNPGINISFTDCGSVNGVFPWQRWSGVSWVDLMNTSTDAPAVQQVKPSNIYIGHGDINMNAGVTLEVGNNYRNMVVESDGILFANGTLGVDFDFASVITVASGGLFEVAGPVALDTTSLLLIENDGILRINDTSVHSASGIWNGKEQFDSASILHIMNWNQSASQAIVDNAGRFSENERGYLFGNIVVSLQLDDDCYLVRNSSVLQLSEKDLVVQSVDNKTLFLADGQMDSIWIGGDVCIDSGDFVFGVATPGGIPKTIFIGGDFSVKRDSTMLVRTPSAIGSMCIDIDGSLRVDSAAFLASEIAGTGLFFSGKELQHLDVANGIANIDIVICPEAQAKLTNHHLMLSGNCTFTVDSGAVFDFGYANELALEIRQLAGGNNGFIAQNHSTLIITSPEGISNSSGVEGNVSGIPASNRSFSQLATFHYIGNTNQTSGDALTPGSSGKVIIIELAADSLHFRLENPTGISNATSLDPLGGRLEIRTGTVIGDNAGDFAGSGRLAMTGGKYRIESEGSTALPRLMGGIWNQYELSGGTIELAADGIQVLRGNRSYHHVLLSGNNGLTSTSKVITSSIDVDSLLEITDGSILDTENHAIDGSGGVSMSGGRLRMSKLNTSLPGLTGEHAPYQLAGGVIEWYGSDSSTEQLIRGTDYYGNSILYHSIELNATEPNLNPAESNINAQASFGIQDTLKINAPVVFRLDATDHVFGAGHFVLDTGATLLYGSPDGIKLSGATTADGNIRVDGSRILPAGAGYGFVGPGTMNTGKALPDTIKQLFFFKTNANDSVVFQKDHYVSDLITFQNGVGHTTDTSLITILEHATVSDASDDGYLDGPVAKSGSTAFEFPIGDDGVFAPLGISAPQSTDALYVAKYFFKGAPQNNPSQMDTVLDHVSYIEYWELKRKAGVPVVDDVYVTLHWRDAVRSTIVDINDLVAAGYDTIEGHWRSLGGSGMGTVGSGGSGSVSSASKTTAISTIAFGSKMGVNPLPVTLVSFTAEVVRWDNVMLKWSTAAEIDHDYFVIERSANGVDFVELFRVLGKGTSSGLNHYVELDEQPLSGWSYYRLKQVDLNGDVEYSALEPVFVDQTVFSMISIYQHHQNMEITIDIQTNESALTKLLIYDLSGKLIMVQEMLQAASGYWQQVDISRMQCGIYYMLIQVGEQRAIRKFLKQ